MKKSAKKDKRKNSLNNQNNTNRFNFVGLRLRAESNGLGLDMPLMAIVAYKSVSEKIR
jgi:hypothetical protein